MLRLHHRGAPQPQRARSVLADGGGARRHQAAACLPFGEGSGAAAEAPPVCLAAIHAAHLAASLATRLAKLLRLGLLE